MDSSIASIAITDHTDHVCGRNTGQMRPITPMLTSVSNSIGLFTMNPDARISSMRLYYGVFMKKPGCLEAVLDGLRNVGLPE